MHPPPESVTTETPLRKAAVLLRHLHTNAVPVLDEDGKLTGILSLGDIENAASRSPDNLDSPVRYFCTLRLVVTYPDESLHDAMELMAKDETGQLPVLLRDEDRRMVGWLDRSAIIHSYRLANRL